MNTINNEKIKTYDELNINEKELLDIFRTMKLNCDQARFELYSYRLNDLIQKYENIVEMRRDAQSLFFELLEEIDKDDLSTIDVSAEELGWNREADINHITHELNIIQEYAVGFKEALALIYDGTAERILIEDENSW